jgi:ribosomal protein L9
MAKTEVILTQQVIGLEVLRQRRAEREAHEFNTMNELAKSVSKLIALIKVKTGEDGKLFGSVTPGMIADQLKSQFDINLDRKKIHLEHPIRTLGEHDVELRLHHDITATLKVKVESTTPMPEPPPPPPAPPAEGAAQEAHDRRGRRPFRGPGRPRGAYPAKGGTAKGGSAEGHSAPAGA